MVYYCSVKGCKNNSKMKKKDPDIVLSFHAFPTKEATKQKWLRAIGRPSWKPPSFARICSAHFDLDQISYEGCRIRMMDDACPVNGLPPNSNFEASNVEVCRMCLASDLKMFSLQEGLLNTCLQSFAGLKENCSVEGLPQFVCFECSARLINCYNLIEQSSIAQAVLLDLFTKNGQVTKSLVKKQDRKALGLESSLQIHNTTHLHKYSFNEDNTIENNPNIINKIDVITSKNTEANIDLDKLENAINVKEITEIELSTTDDYNEESSKRQIGTFNNQMIIDNKSEPREVNTIEDDFNDSSDDFKMELNDADNQMTDKEDDEEVESSNKKQKDPDKQMNSEKSSLTESEKNMLEFFRIALLTREQQEEQWEYVITRPQLQSDSIWECEKCDRKFVTANAYNNHKAGHDPSRGNEECPICSLRFKTDKLVQTHVRKYHEKIFYCKTCSRSFYNVNSAKAHHRKHIGQVYKCAKCDFESRHERTAHTHCARALNIHLTAAHEDLPKSEDTKISAKYPCDECGIHFASEETRRVHLLTSKQHRKQPDLCDPHLPIVVTKTTCSKCGSQFPTTKDLITHMRTEHPRPKRSLRRNDGYPVKCQHCEEIVNSRWQHWLHVRRQHPEQKHLYRAQHNFVCHRCGKQFQNSTKLRMHELGHGAATLPCNMCARKFHHTYALRRHARNHRAPAYACRTCARPFRTTHNLHRHQRVHTGESPYGCNLCGKRFKHSTSQRLHIRSVHCNLPAPKRNKLAPELDLNNKS